MGTIYIVIRYYVPTDSDFSLPHYQELAEFRHQLRRFLHFSEEQARAQGLEPHQHQALLALKGLPAGGRPTIGELADRLLLRHHTTVELVNRMEAAGWVRRESDPNDGRVILVQLTSKGANKLRALTVAHRDELAVEGPKLARALRAIIRESQKTEVA